MQPNTRQLGTHAPYEWHLLHCILPAFIGSLPSGRHKDRYSSIFIPIIRSKLELICLEILQDVHFGQVLQQDAFDSILQAIRSLLSVFEGLVDDDSLFDCQATLSRAVEGQNVSQYARLDLIVAQLEKDDQATHNIKQNTDHRQFFRSAMSPQEITRLRSVALESYLVMTDVLRDTLDQIGNVEPYQLATISDEEMDLITDVENMSNVAHQLFDLLATAFSPCSNSKNHHEVKMSLEEFRQRRWSFLMSSCDESDLWQPVICLHQQKVATNELLAAHPQHESICGTLRAFKRRKKTLHLAFSNDKWWKESPSQSLAFTPQSKVRSSGTPLRDLISTTEGTSKHISLEPIGMKRFAALLAQIILYLYDSPWMQNSCLRNVFYLERPDGLAPFLHRSFDHNESQPDPMMNDPLHHHAFIINFGILLSELETRVQFHPDDINDIDIDTGSFSPSIMLERIVESLEFSSRVEASYEAIIRACLDFDELVKAMHHPRLRDESRCRAALLKHIVYPLISDFSWRYPKAAGGLLEIPSSGPPRRTVHGIESGYIDPVTKSVPTVPKIFATVPRTQPRYPATLLQSTTLASSFAPTMPFVLFSDESSTTCDNISAARAAEFAGFFKSFREIHIGPSNGLSRIKIAVLDTGLDEEDEAFRVLQKRIMKGRRANNEPDRNPIQDIQPFISETAKDAIGHGTQMVNMIMSYAPQANIYVGKISHLKSVEDIDHFEKAIYWAIGHEVDIISMSFGISATEAPTQRLHKLRSAIKEASRKNILMFAAASNCGGNGRRTYPASDSRVFCVHAVDGKGDDKGFNPPLDNYRDSWGTLGVGIKSSWNGQTVFRSGTSHATPIMVSIVANVLEYVADAVRQQHLDKSVGHYLHERDGMEKMLKFMSSKIDRYEYVTPWRLWEPNATREYICMKLSNELGF